VVLFVKSDNSSQQTAESFRHLGFFTLTFIFKEYSKLEAMLSGFLRTNNLEYFAKGIVEATSPAFRTTMETHSHCVSAFSLDASTVNRNMSPESLL